MLQKLLWWAFSLRVALCDCHSEIKKAGFERGKSQYEITKIGKLPPILRETSGLARATDSTFWTHNDGNNPNELYEVNFKGQIVRTLALPFPNVDWEDLTQDSKGNLYLADIGNNFQNRQDLKIYRFGIDSPEKYATIAIKYAQQDSLASMRYFDSEAIVWHQDNLYIFSKNWGSNKQVQLYSLPAQAGNYMLTPIDSVYSKSMVTAADISPDGKTLAMLAYGKVLFFDITDALSFSKPTYCVKIGKGQAEAILFINNTDLIITNEDRRGVYLLKKKN